MSTTYRKPPYQAIPPAWRFTSASKLAPAVVVIGSTRRAKTYLPVAGSVMAILMPLGPPVVLSYQLTRTASTPSTRAVPRESAVLVTP